MRRLLFFIGLCCRISPLWWTARRRGDQQGMGALSTTMFLRSLWKVSSIHRRW